MPTEFRLLQKAARRANVLPVVREIQADLLTPVSAFLRLNPGASSAPGGKTAGFLLESVEGGGRLARYSFIGGAAPREFLAISGGLLTSRSGKPREIVAGSPVT